MALHTSATTTPTILTTMLGQREVVTRKTPTISTDWKKGLPVLEGRGITLRELRMSDAKALLALLTTEEVTRFISPPPTTVEGFEKFIAWTHRQRAAGLDASFAIVPRGSDTVVGLFQIRALERRFATAEWGFALTPEFLQEMNEYWFT